LGTKPSRRRAPSPGSVEGDERLRLFFGIRLPADTTDALAAWQQQALAGAGRIVPPEHLHVTLAFLGSRPRTELPALVAALRDAAGPAQRPRLTPERYRETRSVGMLVLGDEDGRATAFAEDLQRRLERLGAYTRERRPWLPHVTVLRFREQPRLRLDPPALAPFVPSDAALYHSVLRPSGAQYEVIESAALGG
jgi:RNA 2',3'-cyclic 3'-phosphodiesterase